MKTDKDKEFDDLFKNGLNEPPHEAAYREEDWTALEQKLDGNKKRGRGIIFWLPLLSSAAILLILVGWWFFRPAVVTRQPKQEQVAITKHQPKNTDTPTYVKQPAGIAQTTVKNQKQVIEKYADNAKVARHKANYEQGAKRNFLLAGDRKKDLGTADDKKDLGSGDSKKPAMLAVDNSKQITTAADSAGNLKKADATTLAAINPAVDATNTNTNSTQADSSQKSVPPSSNRVASTSKKVRKSWLLERPQYTLSFIGAPELNGVNSLRQTSSGTNFGVLFSAGIFRKITFSTGALYATKPYNTSYNAANFQGTGKWISSINADCKVLDIPLNIDYQLYNKHQNKFSIGSGVSSYIMLHESYQYNYANPSVNGPAYYTVPNINKYFLSILNLQATYTRQINSKVGISLQPYLKLPLTGIGAGNARLQTAGVAIGLNWNLNSLSIP